MTTIQSAKGEVIDITPPAGQTLSGTVTPTGAHIVTSNVTAPPPDPDPVPTPDPTTDFILGVDLTTLPRSGSAWTNLVAWSNKTGPIVPAEDSAGTAAKNANALMALGLVAGATKDATKAKKVHDIAAAGMAAVKSSCRTLEASRNICGIVYALSAVGDHSLDADLKKWRDKDWPEQHSIPACHEKRGNNWSTVAGQARVAIDAHIGDATDLKRAIDIFHAWIGEPGAPAHTFAWDSDMSWHADRTHPLGVNRRGAKIGTVNVDGVLPDDQRRGGSFPNWTNQNYCWQSMGEIIGTAVVVGDLRVGDDAIKRFYTLYKSRGYAASGDDGWQGAVAAALGVTISGGSGTPGKTFGFFDWLFS